MRTPQFDDLIKNMPPGLERACLRVVEHRQGKGKAIKGTKFLAELKQLGYEPDERQFRLAIHNLRQQGWLVCSLSSVGYFIADSRSDYELFRESELQSRIIDLSATMNAMDETADHRWPKTAPKGQIGLGI